jgi:hypothetical protein
MFRYRLHYWKLVSTYNFTKYDINLRDTTGTGYDVAAMLDYLSRWQLYHERKDQTFDFMNFGKDDFFDHADLIY